MSVIRTLASTENPLFSHVSMSAAAAVSSRRVSLGTPFDLQGFIDGELAAGKRRIVVPPGRHRVAPIEVDTARLTGKGDASLYASAVLPARVRMHLFLAGLDGVEIVADGAEMICTEPTGAIVFVDCKNVTLSGLTIDYDPLPFTQGRITGLSPDKLVHDIELFPDYPAADDGTAWKYEIFVPDTGLLRFGSYYDFKVDRLGDRSLRLTKTGASQAGPGTERVGDIVTLAFVDWTRATLPHAICLHTCTGMTLTDCTLHAANCFGFFETGCDGSTYRRCRVDRRPPETDPRPRAVPRMRSLNADAFHSKHAPRGPRYLDCVARFMGDDCVAINGDYELVTSCTAGTVRVLAKVAMRIREGSTVEVVTPAGRHPTTPRVVKVAPAGPITAAERDLVRDLPLHGPIRGTEFGMLGTAYEVTLDEPLDLPPGSVIAAADALGSGFVIEGCDFGFNRSRGAIVKAGRGRIVGNRFTENWMEAIKLAPEYYWLEAGCGDDVVIEDNTITRCHGTAIQVYAACAAGRPLPAGAHRRITIAANHLEGCPTPRMHVTSTDGLVVRGNTVVGGTAAGPAAKTLLLERCSDFDVQDRWGPPSEESP